MVTSSAAQRAPQPSDIETARVLLHSGEVARALQVVGDRWSFLLMRDAFLGVRRFEDLRRRTGASRGTLTARLNAMVDAGLFHRSPYGSASWSGNSRACPPGPRGFAVWPATSG